MIVETNARVEELIVSESKLFEKETDNFPDSIVTKVFKKDGTFLADFYSNGKLRELLEMAEFAKWCIENKIPTEEIDWIKADEFRDERFDKKVNN